MSPHEDSLFPVRHGVDLFNDMRLGERAPREFDPDPSPEVLDRVSRSAVQGRWGDNMHLYMWMAARWLALVPSYQAQPAPEHVQPKISPSHGEIHSEWFQPLW